MTDKLNRRKFLRGTAVAGAATLATPAIADGHATTLKMQAAWGGGIFLENSQSYVDRVHAMAGKSLKIDLLAASCICDVLTTELTANKSIFNELPAIA